MAFSYYLSTEIIALVITKSYRDSVGVRLYINAIFYLNFISISQYFLLTEWRVVCQNTP